MNEKFAIKVKDSIKNASLDLFNECITPNISELEFNFTIDVICEKIDNTPIFKEFLRVLATRNPKQFFLHSKKISYSLSESQEQLVDSGILLVHENSFTTEIVELLRLIFFYSSNKTEIISKIDEIEFSNDRIREEIDNLELLNNFSESIEKKLIPEKTKINSWTWNFVLLASCIKLEEFNSTNRVIHKVLEYIINHKNIGSLKGSWEEIYKDYVGLLSILNRKKNDSVRFAGRTIKTKDILSDYALFEKCWEVYTEYVQKLNLIEQYCLQGNLLIEYSEDEAVFKFDSLEKESQFRNDGIKYQIENNYFHLENGIPGIQNYEMNSDNAFNHYMHENINKTMTLLIDYGIIRPQKGDPKEIKDRVFFNKNQVNVYTLLSFPSVQMVRGASRFKAIIENTEKADYRERLLKCLVCTIESGTEKGFPFELYNRAELPLKFSKTLAKKNLTEEVLSDVETIVDGYTYNKNIKNSDPFSLSRYYYLQIGDNCFSFRSISASNESFYITFNRLLRRERGEEPNQEPDLVEKYLNDLFERNGFNIQNEKKLLEKKKSNKLPQFDLLAIKDGILLIGELKLTGFRSSLMSNMIFTHRQLGKAAFQLDIRRDYIENNPEIIADLLTTSKNKITPEMIKKAEKKTLILTNSYEFDHQYIYEHLKVSLFEIVGLLNNTKQNLPIPYLSVAHHYPEILRTKTIRELIADSPNITEKPIESLRIENLMQKWKLYDEENVSSVKFLDLINRNVFWDMLNEIELPKIDKPFLLKRNKLFYAKPTDDSEGGGIVNLK